MIDEVEIGKTAFRTVLVGRRRTDIAPVVAVATDDGVRWNWDYMQPKAARRLAELLTQAADRAESQVPA